jgi:predicted Zn-dependent protease
MPQHLREAAHRRHQEARDRATTALTRLSATGATINFASVAREADVSTDFLYRQPQLRQRVQQLRITKARQVNTAAADDAPATTASACVRAPRHS